MLALIVKYLRWEMWRRKGENKGGACRGVQRGLAVEKKVGNVKKKRGKQGGRFRGVQRGLCEKIICKMLAMIVKYLRWEMWRRKGENKGDACRGVQRGLCEKIDL